MSERTSHHELLEQLRSALFGANEIAQRLERTLGPQAASAPREAVDLQKRLEGAEADRKMLADQLVETERQVGKLMGLYVATYQLHASLDPDEVQLAIAEIARDLLGAERFALLLKEEDGAGCSVALAEGAGPAYAHGVYRGGDPLVDATLADGSLRLAPAGSEASVLGVVPLRFDNIVVGALVVIKLFDHCTAPLSEDREILDLLAAHAATALFAAQATARADRKLRTLQSLVQLMRGQ